MRKKLDRTCGYPPDVLQWLEERSDENLVRFFAPELHYIDENKRKPTGVTVGALQRLRKFGIIRTTPGIQESRFILTEKARQLLKEVRKWR